MGWQFSRGDHGLDGSLERRGFSWLGEAGISREGDIDVAGGRKKTCLTCSLFNYSTSLGNVAVFPAFCLWPPYSLAMYLF